MKVLEMINGKFGNKVIKSKYRIAWKFITYSLIFILFSLLMFIFINVCTEITNTINYVFWGIR